MSKTVKITELVAVVVHKKEGKKVVGSHVYIAIPGPNGNIGVAHAIIGGRYNEQQGITEFKNNQKRFTLIENGFNMAKAMNLV